MADTNKIFKALQDYAEAPPRGLYAKLWKKIKKLPPGNKILSHTLILLDTITDAETAPAEDEKILSSLQSYIDKENTAPPFDFKKITAILSTDKKEPALPKKNKVPLWVYRTAAAAAITGIIAIIYIHTNTAKPHDEYSKNSTNRQSLLIDSVVTKPVTAVVLKNTDVGSKKPNNKIPIKQQYKSSGLAGNAAVTKNTTILNNDFFYSLTNFNLNQANDFFSEIKKDKKISMSNYSYVNVSDKMTAFLKQLYAVNRKKKPTWMARRMKAKLNRWKTEDEKNFDIKPHKNPLDILDLSEFIFKK